MYNFEIKGIYSFNTIAPAILGNAFTNVKVLGIIDSVLASQFISPHIRHADLYPFMPSGTPDDPTQYNYLMVQLASGEKTVLAMPWIDESSIQKITVTTITVTFSNASNADVERIREVLALNAFTNFTISAT